MATQVSSQGLESRTFTSEEFSLYSGLSEDELIQMAIEQSLMESSAQQTQAHAQAQTQSQAQANQKTPAASAGPAAIGEQSRADASPWALNQSRQFHRPNRAPQPPRTTGPGRGNRYDGSPFPAPQAEETDPLVIAIKSGDEQALTRIIQSGRNCLEPNKDGWLPVHEAAYYGQLECLKLILRAFPTTIDRRTLEEETPLYIASQRGHVDCLQVLLQLGGEPDIAGKNKETPLYKACERRNVEAVQMLVQYNADVNHRCNQGWTALHEAVAQNNLEIIDLLVKGRAKIDAKNVYNITPLFVAAQSGQLDPLRYLAKCNADINIQASDNATPLFEAAKNGHEEVVEFLLAQGADANKVDKKGLLPIHIAAKRRDNDEIVSMLIPVTSRVRVKRSGISPLHIAAECNNDGVLEELIDAGYDVNSLLSSERSCLYEDKRTSVLYFAVINNNIPATDMLLRAGANPNVDVINPLLISIRHGCLKTMTLLLDHGANVDAYISTHPTAFPATIMFSMKYLSLLKFILDLGCSAICCFNCEYGLGPHPPIKLNRAGRLSDESSYTGNVPRKPVQFCEVVSTPEMSRWAGPIIDVLLDYVGNVQLCSRLIEHLDSYEDWAVIKAKAEPPRPLAHLCRIEVRNRVGRDRLKFLDSLPLPGRLLKFLKYDFTKDF
ncbi:ankyrin repeat and SOCS box protein 2 [Ambystoma mexicanum]|uniref:ankyrin repeat and SOCS box protein 2 n=1 Tax=Ambystoma mexicanum TaxID=8296 RepID=UPI0037E85377